MAIEVRARRFPAFYRGAALGLLSLYGAKGRPTAAGRRNVALRQESAEELLVAWLNELIYLISAQRWLPIRVRVVRAGATTLEADLTGGPLHGAVRLEREIKAATFGGLRLKRTPSGYSARIILDV